MIGGGSNIVFSDEGYPGLVLRVEIPGLCFEDSGRSCLVTVGAGEVWDDVVTACVARGLGGIECLAGIPGTAGATPIQNVGAYGQEVRDTIHTVHVLHRETGEEKQFSSTECGLGYRWSRFKGEDAERYIVTGVVFRLEQDAQPKIRYPELARVLAQEGATGMLTSGEPALNQVRKVVLRLRRSKAMVIEPSDPNSRSVGSFFCESLLEQAAFERVRDSADLARRSHPAYPLPRHQILPPGLWSMPVFPGTRRGKIGISESCARTCELDGGITRDLVALAEDPAQRWRRNSASPYHRTHHCRLSEEKEPIVIRAVIFDFGNVIYSFRGNVLRRAPASAEHLHRRPAACSSCLMSRALP
jgi:UDP-N-acetylmuramate dehydrogenase